MQLREVNASPCFNPQLSTNGVWKVLKRPNSLELGRLFPMRTGWSLADMERRRWWLWWWHAARALRNLANNPEAKKAILKADGVPTLTLVAKHGKGRVKEAADEALKLLSQDSTRPHPILEENKVVDPEGDIPSGKGTRVAMFSARFDGGPIEQTLGLPVCASI